MRYNKVKNLIYILLVLLMEACTQNIINPGEPEYLSYGVINMSALLESPPVTRATLTDQSAMDAEGNDFMVWGYFAPATTGATPGSLYMGESNSVGTVISRSGSNWVYQDPSKVTYWPAMIPLNFQAVNPYDYGTITNSPTDNVPCVAMRVTVPSDNSQQKDLLFGHEEDVTLATHNGSVNLVFEHALSQINFEAVTSMTDMIVDITGVTIHNIRNTATVGYIGSLTGSRRALEVSDYAVTVGNYAIGMVSTPVTVTSSSPVALNAENGILMLLPQSGTNSPEEWNTISGSPVALSVANAEGAEKTYLQVTCKIRIGEAFVLGSESTYEEIYFPLKANWDIGKKYTYTLNFGTGNGGFREDGTQNLHNICFMTLDVEDWDTENIDVAEVPSEMSPYHLLSDLPAVYIETEGKTPITSKDDYMMCTIHYVAEDGSLTDYESVSVKGRGNSTWRMAKKPYKLKFNKKEKFLGKNGANSKKWNILANAGDKTMIRNALTFALGEFTALPFTPSTKFVDLVINGEFMGTYQITDQIEVKKKRVDITEQPVPLTEGFDISGGYLMEVTGESDGNCFTSATYNANVRIRYPDEDDIVSLQTTYIQDYINGFESVLASSGFVDPTTGYRAYVDEITLIDWYICTEISANIDGFYSTYFYKKQGDPKIYFGPLWDYDIAYDNDYRVTTDFGKDSSVGWLMSDIAYDGTKKWFQRMWQDPWFKTAVNNRYRELLNSGLVSYMLDKVDSLKNLIYRSQELNYQKWNIDTQMYHERVLHSTYEEYIDDLKSFITEHCAFLEEEFARRAAE